MLHPDTIPPIMQDIYTPKLHSKKKVSGVVLVDLSDRAIVYPRTLPLPIRSSFERLMLHSRA